MPAGGKRVRTPNAVLAHAPAVDRNAARRAELEAEAAGIKTQIRQTANKEERQTLVNELNNLWDQLDRLK